MSFTLKSIIQEHISFGTNIIGSSVVELIIAKLVKEYFSYNDA